MSTSTPPAATNEEENPSFVTPDGGKNNFIMNEAAKEPHNHDVLCGRGGSINSHPGNERFRKLVEKRKKVYLTARFKREKRLIASSIVSEIRALDPPGKFLARDQKSGLWKDIGDEKARDKTSQALRENAPTIRAEIETEINEQRAEMQRAEEEEAAKRATSAQPSNPYYNQGWGYPSYYGSYPPPHHGPPPPHGHAPPPPPHGHPPHGYPHYPPPPEGHWGAPYPGYPPHGHAPPPHHTPTPPPPKSAFETTADMVSSGAESIKDWAKTSLSFQGVNSASSADGHDSRSVASSKPIVYVHKDDHPKRRRSVKFSDESKQSRLRRSSQSSHSYSPLHSANNSVTNNSLVDQDIEPQDLDAPDDHNSSLMTQVANQILGSIGSWDAGTFCGHDSAYGERVPFPRSLAGTNKSASHEAVEDDMAVEWEGQEVQLVDKTEVDSYASNERMPPPVVRQRREVPDQASSIGFSSLGSCHSWLPEQIGDAASYFSFSRNGDASTFFSSSKKDSPSHHSMDMEYSAAANSMAGTENYSAQGSVGGASLTKVFETETMGDSVPSASNTINSPTNMSHRHLSQIPSWERSLRSKSPLSIGSEDDESLISKSSSTKYSEGALSPRAGAPTSPTPMVNEDDMVWETKE